MLRWLYFLTILLAGPSLAGCDIQPVAVGQWDVVIESAGARTSQTWTVTANGQIEMLTDAGAWQTSVETAGSRFSWTLGPEVSDGESPRNFSGTVNGNRFSGTLYSQAGNALVSGTRL